MRIGAQKTKARKTNRRSTEYVQGRQRKQSQQNCTQSCKKVGLTQVESQKLAVSKKGNKKKRKKERKKERKTERKKHANLEDSNSLQFAIRNL